MSCSPSSADVNMLLDTEICAAGKLTFGQFCKQCFARVNLLIRGE